MKKLLISALVLFSSWMLTACGTGIDITFKIDGETYETLQLDEAGGLPRFPSPEEEDRFFLGWHYDETWDERVGYHDTFEESTTLYGRFMEDDGTLNTKLTDELDIPDYEGKDFFEDGIGEVSLLSCRDGDTADFTDGEEDFRVRYLGMDTPESGHTYEPWGPAASAYACEMKEGADTIVLEREPEESERGTFGRELAYVWVDGRLLNLELIELAYSYAEGVAGYRYGREMALGEEKAARTGRRLYGEDDPHFSYEDPIGVSIQTLIENPEDYMTQSVNIEGTVTATVGSHAFIEEDGHALFFYVGYESSDRLQTGNDVRIENAQFYMDGKPFEGPFLTNALHADISYRGSSDIEVREAPFDAIGFEETGLRYHYEDLTITDIDAEAFRFTVEDANGETMHVYQLQEPKLRNDTEHSLIPEAHRLDYEDIDTGDVVDITVNVIKRHGEIAFTLAHRDDIVIE